jgi:hypothetical protein
MQLDFNIGRRFVFFKFPSFEVKHKIVCGVFSFPKLDDEIDLKKNNRFVFFVDATGSRVFSFGSEVLLEFGVVTGWGKDFKKMTFLGGVRIAAWTDSEIFSAFRCRASDHKEVFVGGLTKFHCGGVKPAPVYHHHHHHHHHYATINSFSGEGQGLKRAWCGNSRIQQQGVAMKALKSFKETDQVRIPCSNPNHSVFLHNCLQYFW